MRSADRCHHLGEQAADRPAVGYPSLTAAEPIGGLRAEREEHLGHQPEDLTKDQMEQQAQNAGRAHGAALTVLVVAAASSGCSGQSGDPAIDRARHFYAAVSHLDGAAACRDLAPEARAALEQQERRACSDAILDQDLPDMVGTADVEVFGSMAQVRFADETAFLSRYGDDWLLTAVGCPPVSGDATHDCAVEVG